MILQYSENGDRHLPCNCAPQPSACSAYKSDALVWNSFVQHSIPNPCIPQRRSVVPNMSGRLMSFTIVAFFVFILGASGAPVQLGNETQSVPALSPRITHGGQGTFFYPGEGNCGGWNNDNDPIIAISTQIYNNGVNCDQWVEITNTGNHKRTYAQVRDSCPSCAPGSLDMSPAVFQRLAPLSLGVIGISWHFMPRGFHP